MPNKRPHFYPGELPTADRLNAVMDHVDRSARELLLALHGPGVIDGLRVRLTRAPTPTVTVTAGRAVDPMGRLVALPATSVLALSNPRFTGAVVLQIDEQPADPVTTACGVEHSAIETVVSVATATTPANNQLVLAHYAAGRKVRPT